MSAAVVDVAANGTAVAAVVAAVAWVAFVAAADAGCGEAAAAAAVELLPWVEIEGEGATPLHRGLPLPPLLLAHDLVASSTISLRVSLHCLFVAVFGARGSDRRPHKNQDGYGGGRECRVGPHEAAGEETCVSVGRLEGQPACPLMPGTAKAKWSRHFSPLICEGTPSCSRVHIIRNHDLCGG